jgi:hypothetical protein
VVCHICPVCLSVRQHGISLYPLEGSSDNYKVVQIWPGLFVCKKSHSLSRSHLNHLVQARTRARKHTHTHTKHKFLPAAVQMKQRLLAFLDLVFLVSFKLCCLFSALSIISLHVNQHSVNLISLSQSVYANTDSDLNNSQSPLQLVFLFFSYVNKPPPLLRGQWPLMG